MTCARFTKPRWNRRRFRSYMDGCRARVIRVQTKSFACSHIGMRFRLGVVFSCQTVRRLRRFMFAANAGKRLSGGLGQRKRLLRCYHGSRDTIVNPFYEPRILILLRKAMLMLGRERKVCQFSIRRATRIKHESWATQT